MKRVIALIMALTLAFSLVTVNAMATGGTSTGTGNTSQGTGDTSQGTGNTSQGTGNTSQGTGNTSGGTGDTSGGTGDTSGGTGDTSGGTGDTSGGTGDTSGGTGDTSGGTGDTSGGTGDTSGGTGDTSPGTGDTSGGTGDPTDGPNGVPNPPVPPYYLDVNPGDWFYDAVMYVSYKNIMNGTGNGMFSPQDPTTRAMIVTMLYRLEGAPTFFGSNPFSDVAAGKYFYTPVSWAYANGVAKGVTDTLFMPDQVVTREQLATFLYRYAIEEGYDVSVGENTNILSYGDAASVSEYAVPAMQWAVGAGIINGIAGNLEPQDDATRAQVATMFMRFMENVVK